MKSYRDWPSPSSVTTLGAACVFFMRGAMKPRVQKALTGFAAGIMVAASIWSLLIPAMEESQGLGPYASLPAIAGVLVRHAFPAVPRPHHPHLHMNTKDPEGPKSSLSKSAMMVLAVTLHNIPEGMAVGVVLAGWLTDSTGVSLSAALALSIGIAIQNFPEGAIISMPLAAGGTSRTKAFIGGVLSGVVEPIGGALTIVAASFVVPILPYLLAFAAGAMMYVVVEELIPEMSAGQHSNVGVITFAAGFTLMMALDTILG